MKDGLFFEYEILSLLKHIKYQSLYTFLQPNLPTTKVKKIFKAHIQRYQSETKPGTQNDSTNDAILNNTALQLNNGSKKKTPNEMIRAIIMQILHQSLIALPNT